MAIDRLRASCGCSGSALGPAPHLVIGAGRAQNRWPVAVDQKRCQHKDANGKRCGLWCLTVSKRLEWEVELGYQITPQMCLVHAVRKMTWSEFVAPLCKAKAKTTGQPCKNHCVRKREGGYYPVCRLHGAKGAGSWNARNQRKPSNPLDRKRARDEQKRLDRKARWMASRAKQWDALSVEPAEPMSPMEERAAQVRKPLKPLY
jgi:hypothetical protein